MKNTKIGASAGVWSRGHDEPFCSQPRASAVQYLGSVTNRKGDFLALIRNSIRQFLIPLVFVSLCPQFVFAENINPFSFLHITAQGPPLPRSSPFGWSVHVGAEKDVWWNQSSVISDYSVQSGAGWVRDAFLLGDKIKTLAPVAYQPGNILLSVQDTLGRDVYLPLNIVENYVNQLRPFLDNRHNLILAWVGGYSEVLRTYDDRADIIGAYGAVAKVLIKAIENARPADHPGEIVIELHNEPNEPGTYVKPDVYVKGLQEMSDSIHAVSPDTKLLATLSHFGIDYTTSPYEPFGYLKKILDLGGLDHIQGFAAHPYRGLEAPEAGNTLMDRGQVYPRDPNFPIEVTEMPSPFDQDGFFTEVSQWTALIQKYNVSHKSLDIHFTEIGYSSVPLASGCYASCETELRQSAYLSRLLTQLFHIQVSDRATGGCDLLHGMKLRSTEWYDLKEDVVAQGAAIGEGSFGVISKDFGRIKPAYDYFRAVANFLGGVENFKKWEGEYSVNALPGGDSSLIISPAFPPSFSTIKSYAWKTPNAVIIPFWTVTKKDRDVSGKVSVKINDDSTPISGDSGFARVTLVDPDAVEPYRVKYDWDAVNHLIEIPVRLTNRVMFLVIETSQAAAEAYVNENFREFFGVSADSGGLAYWSSVLLAGQKTPESYRRFCLDLVGPNSSTLAGREVVYVNQLFNKLYGVNADSSKLQYWVNRLTIGEQNIPAQSRDVIKQLIIENDSRFQSAASNVSDLMYELWGQVCDDQGVDYWAGKIVNQGWTINDVRSSFLIGVNKNDPGLRSREDAFMNTLYSGCNWGSWQAAKNANPDVFDYWMTVLTTGWGGNAPKSQDMIWAEFGRR